MSDKCPTNVPQLLKKWLFLEGNHTYCPTKCPTRHFSLGFCVKPCTIIADLLTICETLARPAQKKIQDMHMLFWPLGAALKRLCVCVLLPYPCATVVRITQGGNFLGEPSSDKKKHTVLEVMICTAFVFLEQRCFARINFKSEAVSNKMWPQK